MSETFPINNPIYNARISPKPSVNVISFGDGFEQRYTEGLNQNPITLNLVFEVNQSEANTAVEFLDDQIKNGTSFNYRLPNESVTRKYVCTTYPRTIPFLDRIRLSCVFRQVFEP